MTGYLAANEQAGMNYRDVWTTAYINDLPDSAFLYIAPGGTKTDGKTDGAHRYFPVKDANGKPDAAHINNAISRIPQASSLSASVRAQCMAKAKAMAANHPDIGSGKTDDYEGKGGSGRSREGASEVMTRSFEVTLELRAEGDGRTLVGRAVPYDQTAEIPGGSERFVLGAFAKQIQGGQLHTVKLYENHGDRIAGRSTKAVGRTQSLTERPDGLHGEWRMYDTTAGEDALKLVKAGEITGLSIGFKQLPGGSTRGVDGTYIRRAVHLDHVALTDSPAYVGAAVMSVRSSHPAGGYRRELERARLILARLDS